MQVLANIIARKQELSQHTTTGMCIRFPEGRNSSIQHLHIAPGIIR
jgi:hypothetical protein